MWVCVCANSESALALGNPESVLARGLMNHEVQRSSCLTMLYNKNRKRSVKKGRDMNALSVAYFSALIWKKWATNEWNCTRQHRRCFRCILGSVMLLKHRRFCLPLVLRITQQIPCCKIIKNIFICHSKSYEFPERRNTEKQIPPMICCKAVVADLASSFYIFLFLALIS